MSDSVESKALAGAVEGVPEWLPESAEEITSALRRLASQPWLISGRDDEVIQKVRRHESQVRDALALLGWSLVVEPGLVRLRKSPPHRREEFAAAAPPAQTRSWFFLLAAASEAMPPRCGLGDLVSEARSAAAEVGLQSTNSMSERRAIVAALRMLIQRGIITQLDGESERFAEDERVLVLLEIHHTRLLYLIANWAAPDPVLEPEQWLAQVERQPDLNRRMRAWMVDDAVIHAGDLDVEEGDWLSRRARSVAGLPIAQRFGLHLERRAEGLLLTVPPEAYRYPRELGDYRFPGTGTEAHAALLLCDHATVEGRTDDGPGLGWRSLSGAQVRKWLVVLADENPSWKGELRMNTPALMGAIQQLLGALGLLRLSEDGTWWFSPATARFEPPKKGNGLHRASLLTRGNRGTAPKSPAIDFEPSPAESISSEGNLND